jgi:hypothetical protein
MSERQKKTTQNYRDNYDATFRKGSMDPNNTSGDRPQHPLPNGVVGNGPPKGACVEEEGGEPVDMLGCRC